MDQLRRVDNQGGQLRRVVNLSKATDPGSRMRGEPGKKASNQAGAGKDSSQSQPWLTREEQLATNVMWITNVTYPPGSWPRGKIPVVLPQRK
jgi:hypothetical protein